MRFFIIPFVFFLNFALDAKEVPSCTGLTSSRQLYDCALKNHPDFIGARLTLEAAEASRDTVTRWPNPQLSSKSVSGDVAGENVGNTEIEVSLDLTELLVKRPALFKMGRAEEKVLTVEGQEKEFGARAGLIRALHRYRQLTDELDLINEAIGTFQKIEGQLKGRRARGPDQDITLSLVELAQSDYQLRKNHVSVEKTELEGVFRAILGDGVEVKKEWLPKLKTNWPKVNEAKVSRETFELRRLEAQKMKYEAEKSVALSESWPKLSAGPVWERETEGISQTQMYGVNINVDIPIFSWNAGARRLADRNLLRAEHSYSFALRKAEIEKNVLIQKYNSAVEALKKAVSGPALKQRHSRIDSLFRQGLTSGTTVIEAHRQISEFTESQHEHELTALESLMMLKYLSGENPDEVL